MLIFLLADCSTVSGFENEFQEVETEIGKGIVLPHKLAGMVFPQCSRITYTRDQDGGWTPALEDIKNASKALNSYFKDKVRESTRKPSDYNHYFIGITLEGNRYIYIDSRHQELTDRNQKRNESNKVLKDRLSTRLKENFSKYISVETLDRPITSWVYDIPNSCHGGEYYFGAYYKVDTNEIAHFNFNIN